jgi:acyl-CoA carboxylase subunit beta
MPADEPVHDPEELLGIGSVDVKVPFEVREVIARIVDGSRFEEFKPRYGRTLVTGWASMHGYPSASSATTASCSARRRRRARSSSSCATPRHPAAVPAEHHRLHGRHRLRAGRHHQGRRQAHQRGLNSAVPHLTLMIGASYGAGNYGMCGRAYDPRFLFTWPNHRIAVMGPKQLAGVLRIVGGGSPQEGPGRRRPRAAFADQMQADFEAEIESQSTAFYATARLWDDGIIDPRDTRTVLGIALSAVHSAPVEGARGYGVFRM